MTRFIRTKAIFEIILIITAIFIVGQINVKNANAEISQTNTCCEQTKSGESCVFTSAGNCDMAFRQDQKECSETSFCQTGCCFNQDGTCGNMASKASCEAKQGIFNKDLSCIEVPLCNKGCCIVGNNYFFSTYQQCVDRGKLFPNLKSEFKSEITDEFSCTANLQNQEKGCCIQDDKCIYTTRDSCLGSENSISENSNQNAPTNNPLTGQATGTDSSDASPVPENSNENQQSEDIGYIFESGKYCSSISLCGCKKKDHKECYDGDVYWFDSCSNMEDKAQDCDYSKNTLCNSKTLKCESLNCKSTFDKKAINGDDIVSYDGVPRNNGESWCEYDGAVGFGQDLVGSRHYRDLCVNGEEFIEPCKDYREEFCIQANVKTPIGDLMEAACKPNNWKDCTTACNTAKTKKSKGQIKLAMQKDRECCEDPKRSCFWSSASDEDIKKINSDNEANQQSLCADAVDPNTGTIPPTSPVYETCTQQNTENIIEKDDGVCIPLVPPGLKFWPDGNEENDDKQSTADAKKVCEVGNKKCTTYFYKNMMTGWKWKATNTRCLKTDFVVSSTVYCRSLGDCGAHYNIASKFSDLAYDCETSDGSCKGAKHGLSYDLLNIDWEKEIGSFDSYSKATPLQVKDISLGEEDIADLQLVSGIIISSFIGGLFLLAGIGAIASIVVGGTVGGISGALLSAGAALCSFVIGCIVGAIILVIAVIILIISFIGADTDKLDVTVSCLPWQAPYGSEDCTKCEDKDIMKKINFNTCSEYKCMSLGQGCKWIPENEGSNRSSCLAINPSDVGTPRIRPWPNVLTEGYSITDFTTGYEITPAAEGYSLITFGILTDEPSVCKYSEEPGIKYDAMALNFGEPYIETKHMLTLTAMPSQLNEIYVKCKDANGNANAADYNIKFNAKAGKDLTPPLILGSSIKNYAVISGGEEIVEIYINEPANCRYSAKDIDYEKMENNLICNSEANSQISPSAKFSCETILNVNEGENTYYFRCMDTKNNANQESFILTLFGSPMLNITSTSPSGELETNLITIEAETEGGSSNGDATCSYTLNSQTQEFKNTNSTAHSTELPQLQKGPYSIPISCIDPAGNSAAASISFTITKDDTPPKLMFLYKQDSTLTIEMDEQSICEYSTKDFAFNSGTRLEGEDKQHSLNIEQPKYNIICSDLNNNTANAFVVYP